MEIRIAIVDDNSAVRKRLTDRFQFSSDIKVVLEAPSADFFLGRLQHMGVELRPHIVLMDIEMPGTDGVEATSFIKTRYPEIEIIIQTVFEDEERIFSAIQAGATGYLLKDDRIDDYLDAIRNISSGGAPISPSIARRILGFMQRQPKTVARENSGMGIEEANLSKREQEILDFLVQDVHEAEIAEKLFISPHTVHSHIKNIYKKLQVKSRSALVKRVLEHR